MRILFVTANIGDAVLSTEFSLTYGQTSDRRDYYCCRTSGDIPVSRTTEFTSIDRHGETLRRALVVAMARL